MMASQTEHNQNETTEVNGDQEVTYVSVVRKFRLIYFSMHFTFLSSSPRIWSLVALWQTGNVGFMSDHT